jgi:hypothetical protein
MWSSSFALYCFAAVLTFLFQAGFIHHFVMGCAFAVLGDGSQRQAGHPEIHHPAQTQSADSCAEEQKLIVRAAFRDEFLAAVMPMVVSMPTVFVTLRMTMIFAMIVTARTVVVPVV